MTGIIFLLTLTFFKVLCAARSLKCALLIVSFPEVPVTVLPNTCPSAAYHLGDRGDGIPVACGDGYAEEAVNCAKIADDLHVAPIQAKDETILSREDS